MLFVGEVCKISVNVVGWKNRSALLSSHEKIRNHMVRVRGTQKLLLNLAISIPWVPQLHQRVLGSRCQQATPRVPLDPPHIASMA